MALRDDMNDWLQINGIDCLVWKSSELSASSIVVAGGGVVVDTRGVVEISVFSLRRCASFYIGSVNRHCLMLHCTTGSCEEHIKAWTKVGCHFLAWSFCLQPHFMLELHGLMLHPLGVLLS